MDGEVRRAAEEDVFFLAEDVLPMPFEREVELLTGEEGSIPFFLIFLSVDSLFPLSLRMARAMEGARILSGGLDFFIPAELFLRIFRSPPRSCMVVRRKGCSSGLFGVRLIRLKDSASPGFSEIPEIL